jgi:hypothetical protein
VQAATALVGASTRMELLLERVEEALHAQASVTSNISSAYNLAGVSRSASSTRLFMCGRQL